MKKFKYIFLLLFLGFLGKNVALPVNAYSFPSKSKEDKFSKNKKYAAAVSYGSAKLKRQKNPKKPKGIQVIVPNVSTHTFQEFYRYSDFTVNEVKGGYSLLLHYSHGKRGPPADLI